MKVSRVTSLLRLRRRGEQLPSDPPPSYSFKGGIDGAVMSEPHALIVYVKGEQLIVADLGFSGTINEDLFRVENWIRKITAEMGYLLIFAGLAHPEFKERMKLKWALVANDAGLELVCQTEWQG